MLETTVAQIAVAQASFYFDRPYSYTVPHALREKVRIGCRVMVPFGGGNRRRQGIIISLENGKDVPGKLKPIDELLDETPIISEELLQLALWMKERTFSTTFECVRAMLPTGLTMRQGTSHPTFWKRCPLTKSRR